MLFVKSLIHFFYVIIVKEECYLCYFFKTLVSQKLFLTFQLTFNIF